MSPKRAELAAKQYAIADFDLMWCERYLVAYIELMTPPGSTSEDIWTSAKSREFAGDFNFLDILGRSLVTSIMISYSRPWSKNRGSDSDTVRLPKMMFRDLAEVRRRDDDTQRLLPFHHDVHERVLQARDKVVAHSDSSGWEFSILPAERTAIETKMKDPFRYLSLEDARQLLENTQSLRSQLASYESEASSKLGRLKA